MGLTVVGWVSHGQGDLAAGQREVGAAGGWGVKGTTWELAEFVLIEAADLGLSVSLSVY